MYIYIYYTDTHTHTHIGGSLPAFFVFLLIVFQIINLRSSVGNIASMSSSVGAPTMLRVYANCKTWDGAFRCIMGYPPKNHPDLSFFMGFAWI